MLDLLSLDPSTFKQTKRLLKEEFVRRGWKAYVPYTTSSMMSIIRDDGVKLDINVSTPPTTSYIAAKIADDKFATYNKLIELKDIRQLETIMLENNEDDRLVEAMLDKHPRLVVKPIDGAHGIGITINITSVSEARAALNSARQKKPTSGMLIQAQYEATTTHEVRVLCIAGKYIASIYRQPARVLGDGIHTIAELIAIENQQPQRGSAYVQLYALIDTVEAETFLGEAISSIPASGEQVNVMGVANYGAGGETIDVTDDIPYWMAQDAIAICDHMNLPLAGVDFIMKQYPAAHFTREELSPVVLEINRTPSLGIHDEPTEGKSRNSIAAYVDYLATLS